MGDFGFWQSVVYEKIPPFCIFYKHLGHAIETCYAANQGFRPQRPNGTCQTNMEKGKETRSSPSATPRYTLDSSRKCSRLALQIVDIGSSITMISPMENQADIIEATAV